MRGCELDSTPGRRRVQGTGVSVSVGSGDSVRVGVDVSVDVGVGVSVAVGVGVSVAVGDGVIVGVDDGVEVGVIVGVSELVGVGVNVTTGRLIGPVKSAGISRSRRIQPPSYCCMAGSVWPLATKNQVPSSLSARKVRHLPTRRGSPIGM